MQKLRDGIALLWSPGRAGGNNVAPSSLLLSWFSRGSCLLLSALPVHHFLQAAVPQPNTFSIFLVGFVQQIFHKVSLSTEIWNP